MNSFFKLLLVAVTTLLFSQFNLFSEPSELNILVIHGEASLNTWTEAFNNGLIAAKTDLEDTITINYYIEFLDSTRTHSQSEKASFSDYLTKKYEGIRFNGAVADNASASKFLKYYSEYLPDIPLLYMSLNNSSLSERELNLVHQYNKAVEQTMSIIKLQNPELKEVVLIKGTHYINETIQNAVIENLDDIGNIKFTVIENFTFDELYKKLQSIQKDSILIYTPVTSDSSNQKLDPKAVLKKIVKTSDKRVYTFWSQFIGAGIVGGAMIDSKLAAEEMVKAVVFYNKYKRFDDNYKNLKLIIDWEGIENNNIPHSKIPKTASIYNKPTSFFIIYFREIIITAIIIVSCLLLIAIFWLRSMASSKKRLKELAETDPLTGLFNRRAFMTYLHYEISRKKRYNSPVSIVIIDIDHFKRVNDLYGHDAGDEVLKTLSELLQQNCRRSDRICRWGGEEFLLLLPETTARNANILAEKLRRLLEKTKQSIPEYITSSFGIAELNDREDFSQWFERADAALYKSKSNGRNQVTVEQ